MSEAVIIFTSSSILNTKTSRSSRFYYHWLLNILAGAFALIGFIIIYWNKTRKGMEHFATYHGWLGAACVLYTFIQLFAGFGLKYISYSPKNYKVVKTFHALSGLVAYSLGLISLMLAFASNWYSLNGYPFVALPSVALFGAIFVSLSAIVIKRAFLFFFPKRVKQIKG